MSTQKKSDVRVSVENIGGIEQKSFILEQGVNLLSGPNSTNKTSALKAVSAALGAKEVRLKSDAEQGEVRIEIGKKEYSRNLSRGKEGNTETTGDSYLKSGSNEARTAELFAFLLESNKARVAVELGENLREVVMEPIDTEEVQKEITRLIDKREKTEEEVKEIENLKKRLEELRSKRENLTTERKGKQSELEKAKEEIADAEESIEDIKERRSDLDDLIEKKNKKENEIERLNERISAEEKSIESLRKSIDKKREELVEIKEVSGDIKEIEEIEKELEKLETRKSEIKKVLSELQEVTDFNSRMLNERDMSEMLSSQEGEEVGVTQEDVFDDNIVCWTCGHEVKKRDISEMVDEIKELRSKKNREVNDIEEKTEQLREKRENLKERIHRKEELQDRISSEESEIKKRESDLKDLKKELSTKRESLNETERRVSEVEEELEDAGSETLEVHRKKKEIEVELDSIEGEIASVEEKIEKTKGRLEELPGLKEQLQKTEEKLSEARNRVKSIEDEAVESFNHHMDEILEILKYENIERIWIQKREVKRREGRRKVETSVFDLNVVREDEKGNVYQDDVESLSESEKEVVGLVFALAGYLAHEVYEDLPFMLIDSIGALDAERVDKLLVYFKGYVPYLLVAVLPETSEELRDSINIVPL